SSAVRDGMRLIAVVFATNSEQARAAETQKLLTYGFPFFETQNFYQKGTELAQATVWKVTERQVKAGLAEDLSMTMPKGDMKKL
ncbi:serine-type D-Ala-D-Ala carboxypeptidase, partial [Pseudomonas syringae pv. tagetis]